MQLLIDIVGGCNLKCPSCPVGNMEKSEGGVNGGVMKLDLLESLIDKAAEEVSDLEFVALYNWAEPLLHPKLPEIISIIKKRNIPVHLSSNLNILKNPDELMMSNPDYFRVSLSGFEQAGYSMTHRGGDIEVVKKNMIALMESKHRMNADTTMTVLFHKYIGNQGEEQKMKVFSEELGYKFETAYAYFMPLEKLLAYVGDEDAGTVINEQDWEIIANLALPLAESTLQARKYSQQPCWLKENQIVLSPDGNVILCCGLYNQEKFKLGSFLDLNAQDIIKLKNSEKSMQTCNKCIKSGFHAMGVYGVQELEGLAQRNIKIYQ
ncbi:MAG: radical SAM protein [Methylomarinum sp.]|nr:radical SAM protein [Methylomarinum sp.]